MDIDFINLLYTIPGILIGLSLHEYAHAQTAVWLGDSTPKLQGRLSTNPLVHIDIIGFIMILFAGFGWAKPVMVNPNNFKNKKRDDIFVSLAGPFMNLLIAFIVLILMKIIYYIPSGVLNNEIYSITMTILDYTVFINIVLFVFNLLPIPPLDGSHVLFGIIGITEKSYYHRFYDISKFILLILIITSVVGIIISPPISMIYNSLFNLFFH